MILRSPKMPALVAGLILLVVSFGSGAPAQANRAAFFYFNPDSPQSNLAHLKEEMDKFLAQGDLAIDFQPFAHLVDFHRTLADQKQAFLLVPDWYFRKHGPDLDLRPLLVPSRRGHTSYRKVLLAARGAAGDQLLMPHLSLATTAMGPEAGTNLERLLLEGRLAAPERFNIIVVPKDSDALFALALGQVDLALVVKENMEILAEVNPRILEAVRPLMETEPIPMPVLCYRAEALHPGEIRKFKSLFLDGAQNSNLRHVMEMLRIDAWQSIPQ